MKKTKINEELKAELDRRWKEYEKYLKSEKNLKDCEPFKRLLEDYSPLYKRYKASFKKFNADIEERTYRREYSRGGEIMTGGYYSPSFSDLVIGGANRGRLYKRPPKKDVYSYEYLFDESGKLICTKEYSDQFGGVFRCIETIFYQYSENLVTSFHYSGYEGSEFGYELDVLCKCWYEDSRLIRYEEVLCSYGNLNEITVEIPEYSQGLLKSFLYQHYLSDHISMQKYTFQRDDEGRLSTYTTEEYKPYPPYFSGFVPNHQVYDVLKSGKDYFS